MSDHSIVLSPKRCGLVQLSTAEGHQDLRKINPTFMLGYKGAVIQEMCGAWLCCWKVLGITDCLTHEDLSLPAKKSPGDFLQSH